MKVKLNVSVTVDRELPDELFEKVKNEPLPWNFGSEYKFKDSVDVSKLLGKESSLKAPAHEGEFEEIIKNDSDVNINWITDAATGRVLAEL